MAFYYYLLLFILSQQGVLDGALYCCACLACVLQWCAYMSGKGLASVSHTGRLHYMILLVCEDWSAIYIIIAVVVIIIIIITIIIIIIIITIITHSL